jgi:hypothetical protein
MHRALADHLSRLEEEGWRGLPRCGTQPGGHPPS